MRRFPKRLPRMALCVLIYAWALAWIWSRHYSYLPASYDSPSYLLTGKSFATGHYYMDFSSPDPRAGALLGPSSFPLLLSLYWRFLDPNLPALQVISALVMALAPVAAFLWLGLWVTAPLALLISLAFGSSYMFIVVGNSFMTELIFTPMIYFSMWLTYRSLQSKTYPSIGSDWKNPSSGKGFVWNDFEAWAAMVLWVVAARTRVVGWFFFLIFSGLAAKGRRWKIMWAGITAAGMWVALERVLAIGVPVTKYMDGMLTQTYPFQVDFFRGFRIWGANVWQNVFCFSTSIDAHILFPYFYDLAEMSKAKRLVCLGIFLWSLWGARLAWNRWASLRPWLIAAGAASLPTILIFTPNDSFRYHVPYFPFIAFFFITPFLHWAEWSKSAFIKSLPVLTCLILAASQSLHALHHDFESEFFAAPAEFRAIHDSLLAMPKKPEICLSPNTYYTYLLTGIHSLHLQGRHTFAYVRSFSMGKEVWALCGPNNDYFCEDWERKGLVFDALPLKRVGPWRLLRVQSWPPDTLRR